MARQSRGDYGGEVSDVRLPVMAGHSRPKDGVASLAYVRVIHVLQSEEVVDARHKAGPDGLRGCYRL
jgi:hypothetical protein